MNLEQMFAIRLISKKNKDKLVRSEVVYDNDNGKITFVFEMIVPSKSKDKETITKVYKQDITSLVKAHGSVEKAFTALVASDMMLNGYLIIPIENGWVCTGGGEIYNLKEQECTCPAFINSPNKRCKHLLYRDALLNQRAKVNEWKLSNL